MILNPSGARLFTIRMRTGFTLRLWEALTSDLDLGSTWAYISEEAGVAGADGGGLPGGATAVLWSTTTSFTGTISTHPATGA